jgi:hypothetical protein
MAKWSKSRQPGAAKFKRFLKIQENDRPRVKRALTGQNQQSKAGQD